MLTECAFFAGVGADHIGKESLLDGRFSDGYVTVSLCVAYIEQNAKLEHSAVCDEWFMKCSQNSWYNDPEHNPEKVIKVIFVGIEDGTGREVYRGAETQRYYLREVYARQLFAKWYVCGERRVWEDGREPRPNLVFQLGDQTEKVVYDDWNGVAAYKDQFNKNFREKVSK